MYNTYIRSLPKDIWFLISEYLAVAYCSQCGTFYWIRRHRKWWDPYTKKFPILPTENWSGRYCWISCKHCKLSVSHRPFHRIDQPRPLSEIYDIFSPVLNKETWSPHAEQYDPQIYFPPRHSGDVNFIYKLCTCRRLMYSDYCRCCAHKYVDPVLLRE